MSIRFGFKIRFQTFSAIEWIWCFHVEYKSICVCAHEETLINKHILFALPYWNAEVLFRFPTRLTEIAKKMEKRHTCSLGGFMIHPSLPILEPSFYGEYAKENETIFRYSITSNDEQTHTRLHLWIEVWKVKFADAETRPKWLENPLSKLIVKCMVRATPILA